MKIPGLISATTAGKCPNVLIKIPTNSMYLVCRNAPYRHFTLATGLAGSKPLFMYLDYFLMGYSVIATTP